MGGIPTMWWVGYQPWDGFLTSGWKSNPRGWISNMCLEIQPLSLVGPDVVVHYQPPSPTSRQEGIEGIEGSEDHAGTRLSDDLGNDADANTNELKK